MKLTLAEPKLLTDSISIISELVNEVHFKIDKDKIELIAMDPANVAMVIFKLLSSAFAEYKVDKPLEIAISLDSLKQILKRAKPSDIVSLEYEKDKLKIQIKGDSTRTFNLALIDLEKKEQRVPNLTFPVKIESSTIIFDEAIEDMDVISESVALIAEKNKFTIEAQGSLHNAKVEIFPDEETSIKTDSKEIIKSRYSIDYLKKIIKASKLTKKVNLYFNKDYPLKLEYVVKDKLNFSVILAPRVSND
ncbi:MAG: proliferating cell nuclear antigen (pcna) [Candidatus Woesearchaeota archaeon]